MTSDRRAFNRKAIALSMTAWGLAACSGGGDSPPGAVSEGEKQALRDAAEMLDEQRPPVDAIAPTMAAEPDGKPDENTEMTGDDTSQSAP